MMQVQMSFHSIEFLLVAFTVLQPSRVYGYFKRSTPIECEQRTLLAAYHKLMGFSNMEKKPIVTSNAKSFLPL
jgi:hypothetical protein